MIALSRGGPPSALLHPSVNCAGLHVSRDAHVTVNVCVFAAQAWAFLTLLTPAWDRLPELWEGGGWEGR